MAEKQTHFSISIQMEVTEAYNRIMAIRMAIITVKAKEIWALDIIVAVMHTALCHHVKPITIRAPDIEDTTD